MPRWGSQPIKSLRQFLFFENLKLKFFLNFFLILNFIFFGFFLEKLVLCFRQDNSMFV